VWQKKKKKKKRKRKRRGKSSEERIESRAKRVNIRLMLNF